MFSRSTNHKNVNNIPQNPPYSLKTLHIRIKMSIISLKTLLIRAACVRAPTLIYVHTYV